MTGRWMLYACAFAALPALAADYPQRPLRMIVTNAPGSAVDVLTRPPPRSPSRR